jgi:RimJ/RimL family protein N-acetyltransferase
MLDKSVLLKGQLIQLEPLQEIHRDILKVLSQDERISTYSPALKLKFDAWFDKALKTFSQNQQFTFVMRELHSNNIVGSTRFYEICFSNRRLTVGYTWLTPSVWGTGVNRESKLLLLEYAFNILDMNRVEFHVDARNERSRVAVKKIGAIEEGRLREHVILDDGYIRDTVIYSILKKEWPGAKEHLKSLTFNVITPVIT